jgi:hypothetical protein
MSSALLEALNFGAPESVLPAPDASIDAQQLAILLGLVATFDDTDWAGPDDGVTYDLVTLTSGITQAQITLTSGITQAELALASAITHSQVTIPEDEMAASATYTIYQGTKAILPWKFTNTNTTGYTFRARLQYAQAAAVTTVGTVNNTTPAASGGGEGNVTFTAAETALLRAGSYRLWVDRTDSGNEDALIDATIKVVAFA